MLVAVIGILQSHETPTHGPALATVPCLSSDITSERSYASHSPQAWLIQWFSSYPTIISSAHKKKKIRENVSKIVNLTFSSGLLFPASAKIQHSEVALSVSVQLYQQLLTSGSHYSCLGSILAFVRPLLGSTFGSVHLEMGRACPIVSQLQAGVCLSGPLFCLPALSAQRNHIVIRKIIINCYI